MRLPLFLFQQSQDALFLLSTCVKVKRQNSCLILGSSETICLTTLLGNLQLCLPAVFCLKPRQKLLLHCSFVILFAQYWCSERRTYINIDSTDHTIQPISNGYLHSRLWRHQAVNSGSRAHYNVSLPFLVILFCLRAFLCLKRVACLISSQTTKCV